MTDHQDYTENRVEIKNIREGDYLLIDLVKYNSHLYNKELKDFKDIEKREQTWREIAASLNISGKLKYFLKFNLLVSIIYYFINLFI